MTECADWQQGLGIELVWEVIKSEEWKRLKLESLADDCTGLRDMVLAMLRGDTHMVDVKKLVKYAWANTYVHTIHMGKYIRTYHTYSDIRGEITLTLTLTLSYIQ